VQSGVGVGTVLGDDDWLAFTCPGFEFVLPSQFGCREIACVDVPPVVAVQHQNVAELGDPAFPV
jgi:hypothetical protein